MAIAALVLGIVSLVFSFVPGFWWLSMVIGIVGIILGALAKKNPSANQGMATAGLVMSIIGVALGLIFWIACYACIACSGAGALLSM